MVCPFRTDRFASLPGRKTEETSARAKRKARERECAMERLIIGEVLKPQGIRGELKIKTYTDFPEDIKSFGKVYNGGIISSTFSASTR